MIPRAVQMCINGVQMIPRGVQMCIKGVQMIPRGVQMSAAQRSRSMKGGLEGQTRPGYVCRYVHKKESA